MDAGEQRACERCGTFAVLHFDGFKAWCEACSKTARAPLELVTADLAGLTRGLLLVVRDWGPLGVGLALLFSAPLAAFAWLRPLDTWERLAWSVVVSSIPEVLLLSVAAERSLGARTGWRAPLMRAAERYLFVVFGNALTGATVGVGALLCLPAYPLAALLVLVVPLVLFERMAPHRAYVASFRRAWPAFWPLLLVSVVLLTLAWLPATFDGLMQGVNAAKPGLVTDALLARVRVVEIALSAVLNVPATLLQLVVWSATRGLAGTRPS